jgi:hypothetical protein
MKFTFAFLLAVFAVAVLVFPDETNSLPAGQLRKKAPAQIARAGRKLGQPAKLKKPVNLRKGKQDSEVAPPPPMTDEEAAAAAAEGDVPAWCDPTKEMGAWLNFVKVWIR